MGRKNSKRQSYTSKKIGRSDNVVAIDLNASHRDVKSTVVKSSFARENEGTEGVKNYRFFIYFAVFFFAFLYWEMLMRFQISKQVAVSNAGALFFIPAEALLFAAFCGVHKRHTLINRIANVVISFIPALYYAIQLVYFRIFGSILSVSLLGMGGEAIGNFGWALRGVIINSLVYLILIFLPVILIAVFSFVRFPEKNSSRGCRLLGGGYAAWIHFVAFVLVAALWYGGIQGLKLMGTERGSAYYVMNDPMSDTDTTAERIGTLATSIVESGSIYLGIGGGDGEVSVAAINADALDLENMLPDGNSADSVNSSEGGSGENGNVNIAETEGSTDGENSTEEEKEPVPEVPHINEAIDFEALAEDTNDNNIRSLCEYFGSRRATRTNEYTGLFEGYNLIYICGEAFSNYGIDPDITPTLYEMATNGIVLNNYYNSFPNTTTNGEYAFATSYWPDMSRWADSGTVAGSFAQSASTFMPYGLGDFFSAEGAYTGAYHNYYGKYYWRDHSWPNLGYENLKFMGSGMTFTSTWPSSDLELFEQSVDDYINEDCFHAYYMTFSGHGPYNTDNRMYRKNIDIVKELAGDKYQDQAILGYFCGEYELELGMEYLIDRLREAGQLDRTVIVITGDHFPYYLPETAKQELGGEAGFDEVFEQYHSTCIIYNSAIQEPIVSDTYCCNVDILPTILNLFGIDYDSRILMGNDIFSNGVHRARLYNGSFITDYVRYDKRSGKKIWSEKTMDYSENVLNNYFEAMLDYTESEYTASLKALKSNFWLYVWKNSGLLTEEEVAAELLREQAGQEDYDIEAAKEEEEAAYEAMMKADAEAAMQQEGQTDEGGWQEETQPEQQQPEAQQETLPEQ